MFVGNYRKDQWDPRGMEQPVFALLQVSTNYYVVYSGGDIRIAVDLEHIKTKSLVGIKTRWFCSLITYLKKVSLSNEALQQRMSFALTGIQRKEFTGTPK